MSYSAHPAPPPDTSVKVTHLVFGLLFLGIAGIWALVAAEVITADRLTVLAPALLIVAGVIGLAASLASTRNRHRRADQDVDQDVDRDVDRDTTRDVFDPAATDTDLTEEIR